MNEARAGRRPPHSLEHSPIRELLAVGLGGFAGAVARYLISGWVHRLAGPVFPWGTLAVNTAGCFALGVLMGVVEARGAVSGELRLFLSMGFLGSLTTFSTFGYETLVLLRGSQLGLAAASVAGNLALGLAAVVAGLALGRWAG